MNDLSPQQIAEIEEALQREMALNEPPVTCACGARYLPAFSCPNCG